MWECRGNRLGKSLHSSVLHLISLCVETLGGAVINNKHDKCLSSESHACGVMT